MAVSSALTGAVLETLKLELNEQILTITISRPQALNALSTTVISELRSVIGQLREGLGIKTPSGATDWSIRGIIVTGEGEKSFVAGADIAEMSSMSRQQTLEYTSQAQELTRWLEELPVPVIAAVNGFALGGGTELALACDLIFASDNAVFGQPEVALGLIPGFGGTVRLQKAVGPKAAKDLILSGRKITATEAKEIGLANRVYESISELLAGAEDYLKTVSAQSPLAVATAKATIDRVAALDTSDGLNKELTAFVGCFNTADMREGTSAFVAKRKPNFTGN